MFSLESPCTDFSSYHGILFEWLGLSCGSCLLQICSLLTWSYHVKKKMPSYLPHSPSHLFNFFGCMLDLQDLSSQLGSNLSPCMGSMSLNLTGPPGKSHPIYFLTELMALWDCFDSSLHLEIVSPTQNVNFVREAAFCVCWSVLSFLYLQCLKQCLAHSRHSINRNADLLIHIEQ